MKFAQPFFVSAFCLSLVTVSAAQSSSTVQGPPHGFTQIAQLTTSDDSQGYFGAAAAISSDGSTVAVGIGGGGWSRDHCAGSVYVYTKPASGWTSMTETAKLTASKENENNCLGVSVAISADGGTVVAGALAAHSGQGAAYVFVKPASGWTSMTETAQLTGSDAYQGMGTSVAMSGHTAVVSSAGTTPAVYVFVEPATGWTNMSQTAKLTSSLSDSPGFGGKVAIDGNTIVVGGCSGQAFLYVEPKNGWTNSTQTARLALQGASSDSVAVSGNTVVLGYPGLNGGNYPVGAAFVFVEPANGWTTMGPTATLTASDNGEEEWVGWAVAVQGDQVFAGAPCTDDGNGLPCQGAVYEFIRPSTGWTTTSTFSAKAVATNPVPGELGFSVAYGGNFLLAGAPYGTLGVAYLFGPSN